MCICFRNIKKGEVNHMIFPDAVFVLGRTCLGCGCVTTLKQELLLCFGLGGVKFQILIQAMSQSSFLHLVLIISWIFSDDLNFLPFCYCCEGKILAFNQYILHIFNVYVLC